jgi:large repetitive protein
VGGVGERGERVGGDGDAEGGFYSRDCQGRITRIIASPPPGVACPATGALNAGCRALEIVYATTTTATASASGDVAGHVRQVNLLIWNPGKTGGAGMDTISVAAYKYDVATRLAEVSDPRNGLVTTYTYTGTNGSQTDPVRLASVKPPGQARIYLDYDTSNVPVGLGLRRVRRDPADGSAGTPVTLATFVYGIPTSGAGLPTVNAAATSWGQGKNPTYGAAVFGADKAPGSLLPASMPSGDWSHADLQYTDELGYTVNTASYGAGAWQSPPPLTTARATSSAPWTRAGSGPRPPTRLTPRTTPPSLATTPTSRTAPVSCSPPRGHWSPTNGARPGKQR